MAALSETPQSPDRAPVALEREVRRLCAVIESRRGFMDTMRALLDALDDPPADDDRFYPEVDRRTGYRTRSLIAAPLVQGDRALGVIEVLNERAGKLFTTSDETRVRLLGHVAAGILARFDRGGHPPSA